MASHLAKWALVWPRWKVRSQNSSGDFGCGLVDICHHFPTHPVMETQLLCGLANCSRVDCLLHRFLRKTIVTTPTALSCTVGRDAKFTKPEKMSNKCLETSALTPANQAALKHTQPDSGHTAMWKLDPAVGWSVWKQDDWARGKKILLHPSLPLPLSPSLSLSLSPNTLVYLGHIMFGLTAVPVTGCMNPACRVKRRSTTQTDFPALSPSTAASVQQTTAFVSNVSRRAWGVNAVTLNQPLFMFSDTFSR